MLLIVFSIFYLPSLQAHFPEKSKFSVFVLIALSAILLEISSTLITCTSIIEKLRTKDCFNSFLNLTPESTFTLELEFARDICHFPLTGHEKKTATPTWESDLVCAR